MHDILVKISVLLFNVLCLLMLPLLFYFNENKPTVIVCISVFSAVCVCWNICVIMAPVLNKAAEASQPPRPPPISAWKVSAQCLSVWSRWLVLNRLAFSTSKQPHNVPHSLLNRYFKGFSCYLRRCEADRRLAGGLSSLCGGWERGYNAGFGLCSNK